MKEWDGNPDTRPLERPKQTSFKSSPHLFASTRALITHITLPNPWLDNNFTEQLTTLPFRVSPKNGINSFTLPRCVNIVTDSCTVRQLFHLPENYSSTVDQTQRSAQCRGLGRGEQSISLELVVRECDRLERWMLVDWFYPLGWHEISFYISERTEKKKIFLLILNLIYLHWTSSRQITFPNNGKRRRNDESSLFTRAIGCIFRDVIHRSISAFQWFTQKFWCLRLFNLCNFWCGIEKRHNPKNM